ncbi:MAG TPA: GatB/YqeY domain-containing protein [Anaerolineae bacterium]|nr:GatB/YqeY domain-containing protein [Anaerolineae bacterium]
MNLKDQLQADLKSAMLSKDELRKEVIRFTLAGIQYAELNKNKPLDEAEVAAVLQTEVKRRRDTIAELETVNRPELLKHEQDQLEVLLAYLPKQMDRDEVTTIAAKVIAELGVSGPQAMGAVMGKLMPQLRGKADGKLINEVVRDLLK